MKTYTLKGLLFAVVYSLLATLLIGLVVLNIWQKRLYLEDQLLAVSQDAATSLGLAISTVAEVKDWVAVSSMVDVIFDSGAYQVIRLDNAKGDSVVYRQAKMDLEGIPSWFVKLLPLKTPEGKAEVMSGWAPVGKLIVKGNPSFAYRDLWATVKWQLGLFAGILIVTYLLLNVFLLGF